jgi:hypothetical protein
MAPAGPIKATTPDPHTLKAINTSICANGALLNSQVLQRNSMRNESTTITPQATAIPQCFNSLITSHPKRKSDIDRQAPHP